MLKSPSGLPIRTEVPNIPKPDFWLASAIRFYNKGVSGQVDVGGLLVSHHREAGLNTFAKPRAFME